MRKFAELTGPETAKSRSSGKRAPESRMTVLIILNPEGISGIAFQVKN
jgi:hypothetical protein